MPNLLTGLVLTLMSTLAVFFALGHAPTIESMIRAKKVTYDLRVDGNEVFHCNTTWSDLRTEAKDADLYVPIDMRFYLQTHDGTEVKLLSLAPRCLDAGIEAKLEPPFDPAKHRQGYSGNIMFPSGTKNISRLEVAYSVSNNMSLTYDGFKKRWLEDHGIDDFVIDSRCHWDEIEIQFHWPHKLKLDGEVAVKVRKRVGASEQNIKLTAWHPESWLFSAKDVAPGAEIAFQWKLQG